MLSMKTSRGYATVILSLILLIGAVYPAYSFPIRPSSSLYSRTNSLSRTPKGSLWVSEETPESPIDTPPPSAANYVPGAVTEIKSDSSLPIPSPVLLGTSMVLGIAGTGSIFELMGGNPKLGILVTAGIAVVGLPGCLLLFLAAIRKATEETEEDDKQFFRGK